MPAKTGDCAQADGRDESVMVEWFTGVDLFHCQTPIDRLEARGLLPFVRDQYGIG